MAMVFQWKEGARVKIDAQAAGERMEKIRSRNGGHLTPALVVRDARNDRSPLHPHFEWDDARAATAYREEQAGYLIRKLTVQVDTPDQEEPRVIRAFVSIATEEGPRYDSTVHAMSDAALRAQVLQRALRELQSFREKYAEYSELAGVFEELDRLAAVPKAA